MPDDPTIPAGAPPRYLGRLRIATLLMVVGSVVVMGVVSTRFDEFRDYAGSPLGLVLFFVLSVISNASLLFPLPSLVLTALVGSAVPPVLVGVIAGVGQTIGELTGYLAGYTGQTLIPAGFQMERVKGWLRRYGPITLFVLGALPNPLFDIAGVLAGALRMPVWHFLAATGLGKILKNIVVAYLAFTGTQLGFYVSALIAELLRIGK